MNKKQDIAEQSLELSKMFHEIKNPLTFIYSSLQLIEDEHPEVCDFRFWNRTVEDTKNLCRLLNELSSFQKCSRLNMTLINSFDFTEDLLESMETFLLETGTLVTVENCCEDFDFYADSLKLRHAVINLLKNAAESSEKGSPLFLQLTAEHTHFSIIVKDQGCGISPEQLPELFNPFYTTKANGTGLGLPIVKRIVEAHQGTLTLESTPGTGSLFCIRLPLV